MFGLLKYLCVDLLNSLKMFCTSRLKVWILYILRHFDVLLTTCDFWKTYFNFYAMRISKDECLPTFWLCVTLCVYVIIVCMGVCVWVWACLYHGTYIPWCLWWSENNFRVLPPYWRHSWFGCPVCSCLGGPGASRWFFCLCLPYIHGSESITDVSLQNLSKIYLLNLDNMPNMNTSLIVIDDY